MAKKIRIKNNTRLQLRFRYKNGTLLPLNSRHSTQERLNRKLTVLNALVTESTLLTDEILLDLQEQGLSLECEEIMHKVKSFQEELLESLWGKGLHRGDPHEHEELLQELRWTIRSMGRTLALEDINVYLKASMLRHASWDAKEHMVGNNSHSVHGRKIYRYALHYLGYSAEEVAMISDCAVSTAEKAIFDVERTLKFKANSRIADIWLEVKRDLDIILNKQ